MPFVRLLGGLAPSGDECFDFGQVPAPERAELVARRDQAPIGMPKYGAPTVTQQLAYSFYVAKPPRWTVRI